MYASLNPAMSAHHDALLILGSVGILGGALGFLRLFTTVPSPTAKGSLIPQREFLEPEITPTVLMQKIAGRTKVQTNAISETYRGKWMRLDGVVRDVHGDDYNRWILFLESDSPLESIGISFDRKWNKQLSAINKGDTVTLIGRINYLNHGALLEDAEIIHIGGPKPQSEPETPNRGEKA